MSITCNKVRRTLLASSLSPVSQSQHSPIMAPSLCCPHGRGISAQISSLPLQLFPTSCQCCSAPSGIQYPHRSLPCPLEAVGSPPQPCGQREQARGLHISYLPGGISVSEIAEVVSNPLVDGREGDVGPIAAFHRHADEGGIGVGRLDVRVGLVVHVVRELRVRGHGVVCCP